jgi:hypothetical protein
MRRLLLAALLAGCAGVETDITRAEWGEFFADFVKGKDRGVYGYRAMVDKSITVVGSTYQYVPPAHVSHYFVERAVRGLGGTELANSDYLALAVDKLLFVLGRDPTGAIRSEACEQLGRLLLPLPKGPPPAAADARADQRINQIAQDLLKLHLASKDGQAVPVSAVLERMQALYAERPPTFQSAQQMVRVLANRPVVGNVAGPIREYAEEIGPPLVRDSILVSLAEVATGTDALPPDESPLVRFAALGVLTRVAAPVARGGAIARLTGGIDPLEPDPDVRRALLGYLGAVGGPGAFEACVSRLDDLDLGVRLSAQEALQEITGARVEPTADAWRAWHDRRTEPPVAKAAK